MHFPIPQVTTLVLLAHSLLGCCWHHAHACAEACCADPAPMAASCACHSHPREQVGEQVEGRRHSDGAPSQNGQDDHQCQGQRCTYTRTKSAAVPDPPRADGFRVVIAEGSHPASVNDLRSAWRPASVDVVSEPPLRAHLRFCVLLI
jgi:hypothetical protein